MFGTKRPRRTIKPIHTQTLCLHPLKMLATSSKPQDNDDKDVDIWRHTMLRYLGYTNELGESFRPIFPKFVVPSYVVSFGYVFCDTADKTIKAQKEAEQ